MSTTALLGGAASRHMTSTIGSLSDNDLLAAPPNSTGAKGITDSALLQADFSRAVVAKGLISNTLLEVPPSEAELVRGLVVSPLDVVVATI